MSNSAPRVSIGLPTYNRPDLLALVLESFRRQTFADFELIISDNASPNPEVRQVCERYVDADPRVRYVRQPVNQGAERNFWFVYDQAQAPLFLWASDDDLWPTDFLERGVAGLDQNPRASAWFCQVVNINMNGDIVRSYPSFNRFRSSALKFVDLVRFLWEPEIMGKANLIYSVFRRQSLAEVIEIFRDRPLTWGSDMNLVYGYLCRFNLIVDDQLVLQKRVLTEVVDSAPHPRTQIYPREERAIYFENYRRAAAGTGYGLFTAAVLAARSAYDYSASGRAARDYEKWQLRLDFEEWRKRTLRDFEDWCRRWTARMARFPHLRKTRTWAHLRGFFARNFARIRARLPGLWAGSNRQ
jgi:glycosyltransferase involved in cell wall biosynthesis